MKRLSLGASRRSKGVELNMSPLIDMVFILLIFFLVTTSFVKEAGVEVKQPLPSNQPADDKNTNMMLEISKEGYIYIVDPVAGSLMVDIRSVRSRMERWFNENPMGSVLIISNPECRWGVSIEVLDRVRAVGIKNVAVVKGTG
jgi:biopolymer transport protein ExbD